MSRLRVDLGRLDDFVRQLQRVVAHLDRVRGEVDARVEAAQLEWTGRAATAQLAAHARWVSGAAELHAALEALRSVAATAHANYAAAASANRRMWSR